MDCVLEAPSTHVAFQLTRGYLNESLHVSHQLAPPFCFSKGPVDDAVTKRDCTGVEQGLMGTCSSL